MSIETFNLVVAIIVTGVFLLWIVPEVITILWYLHKEDKKDRGDK